MALERILVSPEFLFRIERDPANVAPGAAYRISDLELASRLSFFLWSSIPDDPASRSGRARQAERSARCWNSRFGGCSAIPARRLW